MAGLEKLKWRYLASLSFYLDTPEGESVSGFIQVIGRIDCLEIEGLVPLFPGWLLARVCSLLPEAAPHPLFLPSPKPVTVGALEDC